MFGPLKKKTFLRLPDVSCVKGNFLCIQKILRLQADLDPNVTAFFVYLLDTILHFLSFIYFIKGRLWRVDAGWCGVGRLQLRQARSARHLP